MVCVVLWLLCVVVINALSVPKSPHNQPTPREILYRYLGFGKNSNLDELRAKVKNLSATPRHIASLLLAKSYTNEADDGRAIAILRELDRSEEEVALELGFAYSRRGLWLSAIDAFSAVQPPTDLTMYHRLLATMKGSRDVDLGMFRSFCLQVGDSNMVHTTKNLECQSVQSLLALHSKSLDEMREAALPRTILFPSLLEGRRVVNWEDENLSLRLAAINQLPVDGRQYRSIRDNLDDKIGLHKIMIGSKYVPRGFVLGEGGVTSSTSVISGDDERFDWVIKDPKGWGGFGLNFVYGKTGDEVAEVARQYDHEFASTNSSSLLVQEMVKSKIVDGCCFSIRLYVILRDGQVFYSKDCLMKLSRVGERVSNSAFTGSESSQREGWVMLEECKVETLEALLRDLFGRLDENDLRGAGHIPKILGLDLMISHEGELKLIEVNGTPGLIARGIEGEVEFSIKKKVMEEAWGNGDEGLVKL